VVLLDHMVILFLGFWGDFILISIVVAKDYSVYECSFFTHSCQYVLFSWWLPFWLVRSNLNVVLICISLITKDTEYFFTYLLAICISFENCLVQFICPFINWIIFSFDVCFLTSLYILHINPLPDDYLEKIFLSFCRLFFCTLVIASFALRSFLIWYNVFLWVSIMNHYSLFFNPFPWKVFLGRHLICSSLLTVL
jgi:hypothetical protein